VCSTASSAKILSVSTSCWLSIQPRRAVFQTSLTRFYGLALHFPLNLVRIGGVLLLHTLFSYSVSFVHKNFRDTRLASPFRCHPRSPHYNQNSKYHAPTYYPKSFVTFASSVKSFLSIHLRLFAPNLPHLRIQHYFHNSSKMRNLLC